MPKVLIVDDAAFMRTMLKRILAGAGYECVEAGNGVQAVETFGLESPDLVTMDITMPEMDGIAALQAIRAKHPSARIVMCSAMGQESLVLEAIAAGAVDFVVKPFKPDRVLTAVAKALGAARV